MKRNTTKIVPMLGIAIFSLWTSPPLRAQAVGEISGIVKNSSGGFVSGAMVTIKDVDSAQSTETKTNRAGIYSGYNLVAGRYAVSVSAVGMDVQTSNVTVSAGGEVHADFVLLAQTQPQQAPTSPLPAAPQPNSQTSPAQNATTPSLQDLGFGATQTQGSAQQQALLNKRTHMLKVHQTLGLITAIPMAAALITGPQAKAKGKNGEPITEPTSANLDFHAALGSLTTGLYITTACYAIFAPKVPGVKPKGAIRLHRDLGWVHGPGMIITPILGAMAYKQENAGEKVHGIASAHGTAAYITAAAYGASIVAVSWPIHWKFWER